jgi:hypothetical protein
MVHDPKVQYILWKKTTTERAASREIDKLAQLEADSVNPLYPGCDPGHTCHSVTLKLLDMMAKYKCNDPSLSANLQYLNQVFPNNKLLPRSINEAKNIVCPLDLPHIRYHACINDCIIYRNENEEKLECPVCKMPRYKRGSKAPQIKRRQSSCIGTRIGRINMKSFLDTLQMVANGRHSIMNTHYLR